MTLSTTSLLFIIALRNEKGSYNQWCCEDEKGLIIALRNEKGSYNLNKL